MRLGQLSRKIGISTSEIIQFLAINNITINEDSNTKIEDDHTNLVTQKYAPHLLESVESIADEKVEAIKIEVAKVETEIEEKEVAIVEQKLQIEEEIEATLPEVIKAPKIELSGLKVLGKIELPEKKKKEEQASIEEAKEGVIEKPNYDRKPQPRREYLDRPSKNPIALQREREEREAAKKRKEQAQREKEKKTYNYLSKVQIKAPIKKARHSKGNIEEEVQIEMPEKLPASWWGRFMRWLNT